MTNAAASPTNDAWASLLPRCWVLVGPTASGKTAVSLELARRRPIEILALDSMTLYRGLDIGTAKPSAHERAQCPHHLLDLLDPWQTFSVAQYLEAARTAVEQILSRGHIPLFVGGSGLYLRSLLRGVFDGPAANPARRAHWEAIAAAEGSARLHDILRERDPASAARLHPNDLRRLIRALEVFDITGVPLSEQQLQQAPCPLERRPALACWLEPPRDWLYQRIDARVEQMFAEGLLDEAQGVLIDVTSRGETLSHTARQAIGYRETWDWLEQPERGTVAELITQIQTNTRQFAKRQHTWFRHLEELTAIEVGPAYTVEQIADALERQAI